MSISLFIDVFICLMFFLDFQKQDIFLLKRGYIWWEKSSISYTFMYLAYIFFHWHPRPPRMIMSVIKRTYFVHLIASESIYLKSVHSGPTLKATISHDLCYIFGLYFASFRMWRFYNYFEDGRMLESVGIISSQHSLDLFKSQNDYNTIYDLESQTCNLSWQPYYNRCKLTIKILWCYNSRPKNTFHWT